VVTQIRSYIPNAIIPVVVTNAVVFIVNLITATSYVVLILVSIVLALDSGGQGIEVLAVSRFLPE
jgi:hypothetical protein